MKNKYISKDMRNRFSKSIAKLKVVLFLFLGIAISANLNAQNSHTINTAGNTFSPSSLVIDVGDTVTFNNTAGSHNVNGTQVTFPTNPEGFGNGVAAAPWSFQWVFTVAGTYNYQCDPHAPGMSGVIIAVYPPGCPPSFSYTTVDATDAFTNDGEITVTVDPLAVGPFDYYLFDVSGLIQGPFTSASNVYTFLTLASGYYEVAVNNQDCAPLSPGFNSIDSINIYSIAGGTITYSGFMGYCGSTGANITAYSNGCASPTTIGNQFILTDISGTLVDSSVLISDSISYTGLMANQYILQITNLDNNCISVDTFTISANSLQSVYTYTNPSSSVATDGSITITSNGTAPFSISIDNGSSWNPWINGDPIPNLAQGTYICWILDALGCISTDTIELIYNDCFATLDTIGTCYPLMLSAQTTNTISGVYAYTYNLYFEGTLIETINNSALDSISFNTMVSDSGQYLLEITNDSTGCISSDSLVLDPNTMSINLLTFTPVSSQGACNGFIAVEVIDGAFPYSITWDTSGTIFSGPTLPFNTSSIPSLCENTYCISVTDATPCTITECYDIVFAPCNTTLSITDSIDCFGGIGEITATIDTAGGGIGPITPLPNQRYTYTLYSTNPQVQIGLPISTDDTSNVWPGLFTGFYLVDVIDNSYGTSCTSDSLFLPEPDPIVIYTTVDSTSAPFIQDGVITIDSITGGTPPYNITWLDSVGIPLPTFGNLVQDSLGYSNQYNGGYTINVTDTNGCSVDTIVYVHPKNAGDSLHFDTLSIIHPTCFGDCDGKLWAHVYGIGPYAVPPFTFEWYDLVTGTLLRTDSCVIIGGIVSCSPWYSPSHIATHTNLCAGVYRVQAYDYYGNAFPDTEFPELIDPDSMYVQLAENFVIPCGEDSVLTSLVVGGNSLNDTLLISTETLNVNIANGFSENLIVGKDYLMVVSGTYIETATGNTFDAAYQYDPVPPFPPIAATVPMNWEMDGNTNHRPTPDVYQITHSYNFPFVGNGTHTFEFVLPDFTGDLTFQLYEITLDTSIYTYSWVTDPPSFPIAVISTADTALAYPGTDTSGTNYILTVTDANGCEAKDTVNVSWDLYILNFDSIAITNVICNGDPTGAISVTVDSSSGFTPYSWTQPELVPDSIANGPLQLASIPEIGLYVGNYVFRLQDSIGCLSLDTIVTITEPDSVYACGIDTAMISVLVDEFTMNFDTITVPYSYTTVSTQPGIEYKLIVSGTYFDSWNNNPPVDTKDAAYQFNDSVNANPLSPPLAINEWGWNGSTARPAPDVYDPATHTYEYDFTGDGANQVFTYTDSTAYYSNNGGSLIFELYKIVCSKNDTAFTCYGDSVGTAALTELDGGIPFMDNQGNPYYNIEWTDNSGVVWGTNDTVVGLPAGNYTATITDSLGCLYERYLFVLQPDSALEIDSLSHINVMCKGDSTGVIYAVVSGGFGSKYVMLTIGNDTVYSVGGLSGLSDTIEITGLPVGIYEFYIYDTIPDGLYGIYGCEQNVQITITEPQDYLFSTITLLLPVKCWGDSTGKAESMVFGGQFPYTYAWDNGETTPIADSLWADVNAVYPSSLWQGITFTDSNGCTLRDSIQVEHLNPEIQAFNTYDNINNLPQTYTAQVIENASCFGVCDAIATLSTIGGVLPHSYWWDVQSGLTSANMPDTVSGLCAGGHDILVEDGDGCRTTIIFMVTEPDELSAWAIMTQPVQCFGFDDGTAFGSATGGTAPYTFVWDSINGQTGQNVDSLTPGVHTLYVTDVNGCTASDTVVITEPDLLQVEIIDSMTVYSYCTNTNSGQLCAIATGGTPNYTYTWNGGQNTPCAYNLMAGNYTVLVQDNRNCMASVSFNLDSITNTMIPDSVVMTIVDVSCFGDYNGSVTINSVGGAVAPFTYNWTPAVGTTDAITSLYAGSYAVVIEDSNGCELTVNAQVDEPDALTYTTYTVIEETCFGACDGQIWVDVQGGTEKYYYDDSELGIFPIPSANQVQLVNDSLILNLCSGLHSIYITDENNCEGAVVWGGSWQEVVVSGVVVTTPLVANTPASCSNSNDGAAWIPFPYGDPLFTYTWETFPITTTVDTGESTSALYPGDYVLVAHYADSASFGQVYSGCDASSAVFTIFSPPAINSNAFITDVLCFGDSTGSIVLDPLGGGAGSYAYLWDITTSIPLDSIQNQHQYELQPGTYTVTITDASGCEMIDTISVGEPDALTAIISFTPPLCNLGTNGSAIIVVDGGMPAYGYSWDNGGGTNANLSSIGANIYTCTVTDVNLCTASFSVTVTEPSNIIATAEANSFFGSDPSGVPYNVNCNGSSNGTAIVTNGGGVEPITYSWNTTPPQTTNPATNLGAGVYTVIVTDANGCMESDNVTIIEPGALVANGVQSGQLSPFGFDISCYGLSDGWVELDPSGGVPSNGNVYYYSWTGPFSGQSTTSSSIYNLIAGTYNVTITDANGCQDNTSYGLTQPTDTFAANVTTINYAGPVHGPASIRFIDATTTSANDPVNHDWYWGDFNDPDISLNSAGMTFAHTFTEIGANNVYVLVKNANTGCIDSVPFIIEVQGVPEINNVFSPNNDGINDGFTFGEHGMDNVEVYIYNRWGQEVYSWVGENKAWDGRGADGQDLPAGVYFFVLKADGIDGHYYEEKGSVTLLR